MISPCPSCAEVTRPNATVALLESVETEAWADLHRAAPPALAAAEGIHPPHWVGGALAAVYRRTDVLALNRVIGLGADGEVPTDRLDGLLRLYRSAGVRRFFVQLAPDAEPTDLPASLTSRGFRLHNRWTKLSRPAGEVPRVRTDLRLERLPRDKAAAFGDLFAPELDWPRATSAWLAATVGRARWHHYAAFDGDQVVAAAALHLVGDAAWLGFAATHPAHRRRGAQAALLAKRIEAATAAGAKTLVIETGEDRPERPVPSFRNVRRAGFEVAYLRDNWVREFYAAAMV
ncbi:MAG TPA: GNAT family N-acetyltransferase [Thermoanaerobaculia bacterium]|nr:GNAT family N-acetyltransferase [Thermoanaerobaculia bacterium]